MHSFDEYLEDVDRFLDARRLDGVPVPRFLVGHSLGGAIAALWAELHPDRLDGLVLSAPALRPADGVSPIAVAVTKLLSALAPNARILKLPNADFSRDPGTVAEMASDPLIDLRPVSARLAAELLDHRVEDVRAGCRAKPCKGVSVDRRLLPVFTHHNSKRFNCLGYCLREFRNARNDLWNTIR